MGPSRNNNDACSLRSLVAVRNAEEIRCREEEIHRREEDVTLRREMEALELKILKVCHQREEDDAEEDERRSSLSNNSDRVKNWLDSNAAPLTSLHPFAKPMPRKSLTKIGSRRGDGEESTPPSVALDDDGYDFVPVISKKSAR